MFDYNYLMMSRHEYEERIRKVEQELQVRRSQWPQPGILSQLLYAVGEWLEHTGARLKAQRQPEQRLQPVITRQDYRSGRAG